LEVVVEVGGGEDDPASYGLHDALSLRARCVDFVVEAGRQLVPIEVKPTPRPRLRDAGPLRTFRAEYGKAARAGLLLHTGQRRFGRHGRDSGRQQTPWRA